MKQQQSKKTQPRLRIAARDPRAAAPSRATAPDVERLEEALGMAARIAAPYPEEAEAIERVIDFVRAHGRGEPRDLQLEDVLLALSILITSLDRDITLEERELFAWLDAVLGVPQRAAPVPMTGTIAPCASSVAAPQRPRPLVSRDALPAIPPACLAA